jgi:putative ABC transport system ATP-binding protein
LNLVGGLDSVSSGSIVVGGAAVHGMSEDQLSAWRGRKVGFVFQFFQLLPTLTALENVMLPMDFARVLPPQQRRPRALALLEQMGIAAQAGKLPSALSGGQQQRVAIARALANDPEVLLADEPTGNLDSETARAVLDLLRGLGKTVIIATHERDVRADRTVVMSDGRIVE